MVEDLTTGRLYRYHRNERLITASTAKVQILMALLLKTSWHKLSKATRRDADLMIRYSDNHAADRLWLRIGGAVGFTKAGKKFGLRHTQGVPGDCVDLYCWGITEHLGRRPGAADEGPRVGQEPAPGPRTVRRCSG